MRHFRKRAYRQASKQRPARRKAKRCSSSNIKTIPNGNIQTIPFNGGELIKIGGLTREEAMMLCSIAPHASMVNTMADSNTPSMILWKSDFTDDDPFFRLSYLPNETKANMAHIMLGVNLQDCEEAPDTYQEVFLPNGDRYMISTWEVFLATANEGQVEHVKAFIGDIYA